MYDVLNVTVNIWHKPRISVIHDQEATSVIWVIEQRRLPVRDSGVSLRRCESMCERSLAKLFSYGWSSISLCSWFTAYHPFACSKQGVVRVDLLISRDFWVNTRRFAAFELPAHPQTAVESSRCDYPLRYPHCIGYGRRLVVNSTGWIFKKRRIYIKARRSVESHESSRDFKVLLLWTSTQFWPPRSYVSQTNTIHSFHSQSAPANKKHYPFGNRFGYSVTGSLNC